MERTPASFDERAREGIGKTWVAEAGGAVAGFVVVVDDARRFYARQTR